MVRAETGDSQGTKENGVTDKPIIFFDGYCILCNGFVDFLLRVDKNDVFRFASLQGKTAAKLLNDSILNDNDSVILRNTDSRLYIKSEAALETLIFLGGWWKAFLIIKIFPVSLLDRLYDSIARNRYNWFGKRDSCRLPKEEEKHKILE